MLALPPLLVLLANFVIIAHWLIVAS